MIDGTGHVDSEENESIAQLSSNESALHVQKESHLRPFVVLRKKDKKDKKKKIKLCSQIGFETYAVISHCL